MGFFTLLRMVGPRGESRRRGYPTENDRQTEAESGKAGLVSRLDARSASEESMSLSDLAGRVDFTLGFAVIHEFPDPGAFFRQVAEASKSGAALLVAEPSGHVKLADFESELKVASENGSHLESRPSVPRSHAALLRKG